MWSAHVHRQTQLTPFLLSDLTKRAIPLNLLTRNKEGKQINQAQKYLSIIPRACTERPTAWGEEQGGITSNEYIKLARPAGVAYLNVGKEPVFFYHMADSWQTREMIHTYSPVFQPLGIASKHSHYVLFNAKASPMYLS